MKRLTLRSRIVTVLLTVSLMSLCLMGVGAWVVFGRILDQTGTAYWMARSIVDDLACIGLDSGMALLGAGSVVTAGLTNLMADGPAAASVGPITLNMAAVFNPGTTLIPFMGLATACASSFAYLLVICTPPISVKIINGSNK